LKAAGSLISAVVVTLIAVSAFDIMSGFDGFLLGRSWMTPSDLRLSRFRLCLALLSGDPPAKMVPAGWAGRIRALETPR